MAENQTNGVSLSTLRTIKRGADALEEFHRGNGYQFGLKWLEELTDSVEDARKVVKIVWKHIEWRDTPDRDLMPAMSELEELNEAADGINFSLDRDFHFDMGWARGFAAAVYDAYRLAMKKGE